MSARHDPAESRAENPPPLPTDPNATPAQLEEIRFLTSLAAKVHAALRLTVPLGYEDDTGFHFGPDTIAPTPEGPQPHA